MSWKYIYTDSDKGFLIVELSSFHSFEFNECFDFKSYKTIHVDSTWSVKRETVQP